MTAQPQQDHRGISRSGQHLTRVASPTRDSVSDLKAAQSQEMADLYRRLETQPVIEQAKGMLMAYYGLDADTAFAVLRRWSMSSNTKLSTTCERLVCEASRSGDDRFESLVRLVEAHLNEPGPSACPSQG